MSNLMRAKDEGRMTMRWLKVMLLSMTTAMAHMVR